MDNMRLELSDASFLGASVRMYRPVRGDVERDVEVDVAAVWEIVREVVGQDWYRRDNLLTATQNKMDDSNWRSGQDCARRHLKHAIQTEETAEDRLSSIWRQSTRIKTL